MKSNLLFLATIFATAMVATIATLADEKSTVQQEPSQAVRLPVEGAFPSLAGANGWLNAPPLTPESLHGKVVLVGRTQRATRTRQLVPLPDRAGVGAPCVRWVVSLSAPVPLLAQELLELVHHLLRVKVVTMPRVRRLVPRRVIVLL